MDNAKPKTITGHIIEIKTTLNDFINNHKINDIKHEREHTLMWKLIIGIPSLLLIIITIVITILQVYKGGV